MQTGKGSVKVERSEPKGNLDGFLARLHDSQQNEGRDGSTFSRTQRIRLYRGSLCHSCNVLLM